MLLIIYFLITFVIPNVTSFAVAEKLKIKNTQIKFWLFQILTTLVTSSLSVMIKLQTIQYDIKKKLGEHSIIIDAEKKTTAWIWIKLGTLLILH